MDNLQQPVRRSQRLLSYLICTLIAGQPLLPAVAATITPVTPGSQMDKAGNGVPVLNIATPNQVGISHNQFNDYNVDKPGLILNNATDRLTQTQLGGLIQNNPNLTAGKEARGIINEVVGANRSQLQGFTEVAGKAANVMVVNPYGITCNGCGFINTPQVTLTTGKPTFDAQGNVSSLAVSQGSIIVEGKGLNASQSDALSIIARATEINADIHARDLTVIAGSNRVDAQGKVTAVASQGSQPAVAVDTGALGGMYANRIRLVSSDKGVGVNLGNLNARQGDITLDASGKLTVNNSLASGTLNARGQTVQLSGDHKAGGDIRIASDGDVVLKNGALIGDRDVVLNAGNTLALGNGRLTAGRDIQLQGDALTVDAAGQASAARDIAARAGGRLSQQGQLTAGRDLALESATLENGGALVANRDLKAQASTLRNSGKLQSSGSLTVSGDQLHNQGQMLSDGGLTLTARQLEQNGTLSARKDASLAVSGRLTQGAQGETLSAGVLTVHGGQVEQQGLLSGNQGVILRGDTLNGQQGARITSQQAIDLHAAQLTLGGEVSAGGDLTLNAGTLTTGNSAQIQSGGRLYLKAQQATLNGTHAARDDFTADAATLEHNGKSNAARIAFTADGLTNTGTLVAPELLLNSQHLTNGGLLEGIRTLQLQTDLFDNLQGATLHSGSDLTLNPAQLNNAGLIASDGALILRGDRLVNQGEINARQLRADYLDLSNQRGGLLLAQEQLTVSGQNVDNDGQIAAAALSLSGDRIDNHGSLQGNDSLTLQAQAIDSHGDILSDGALKIGGDSLNNAGLLQGMTIALTLAQQFTQQRGAEVNAARSLAIDAATVVNDGQMLAPSLTLNSTGLVNRGWMQGGESLVVNSGTIDNLAGATLVSGDRADLTSNALNNGGQLQAGHLVLNSATVDNSGTLLIDRLGELTIARSLTNSGLLQANRALTLATRQLVNTASGTLTDTGGLTLALDSLDNSGLLQVSDSLTVTARELNNRGQLLAGQTLDVNADSLVNAGLMQGDDALTLTATTLDNQASGHLLSAGTLDLHGGSASNAGQAQGATLRLTLEQLTNSGTLMASDALDGTLTGTLDNRGQIRSQAKAQLSADSLVNSGKITARDLELNGNLLSNSGLWQGNQQLTATADRLTQSASGQALSGGRLELNGRELTTDGILQGEQVAVDADNWQHQGTVIGSAGVTARITDTLGNQGDMLSEGGVQLQAATLNNSGKLLGEDGVTLRATTLSNQGAVQGGTLAVDAITLANNGTLVGLQALTLGPVPAAVARMALAATPVVQRFYGGSGKLLTQGTLTINGDALVNNGSWQAQDMVMNARSLTNQGQIQSAGSLDFQLSEALTSGADSQIGARGDALLHAATLSNQGQWMAKSLSVSGDSLDNQGAIGGVDTLTVALNAALKQQQPGTLLSGGALGVTAASMENAGRIQGGTLTLNGSTLDNRGRLQGDNGLTLILGDRLTNYQSGTLFSQQALMIQAAQMSNDGTMQGGKQTRLEIAGTAQNGGKLLSSDDLTLNAAQLNNGGWLQATDLLLKAAKVENKGTLLAQQQGTLTGNSLLNQGSIQGDRLTVNYQQLNNSGSVLGNRQLGVTANTVDQQGGGRLFSGGDLTLNASGLSPTGQLVALGDLTATLANAFTHRGTLAAGNQLTLTSNGAIDNQGIIQGQGVNLSAGGVLTNNGKITTGSRASSLSGSQINLNDGGSVQGGGDMALTSRGDITIAGFTGTSGSLTLTAPGSIINTALLYAGQDMRLQANSIRNQRGDILADNNLWMQRDAAGNANAEIINTSGTIETQYGDILLATGHLLNTRDGLNVTKTTKKTAGLPEGVGNGTLRIPLVSFDQNTLGYYTISRESGGSEGPNGSGKTTRTEYYLAPNSSGAQKRYLSESTTLKVSASGNAGRIASGRNIDITATTLDNLASNILANKAIKLRGNTLNNQSWLGSIQNTYLIYVYTGRLASSPFNDNHKLKDFTQNASDSITYRLAAAPEYETVLTGSNYRSVIQAGDDVTTTFSNNISNSSESANAGKVSNTLVAPVLNTVGQQTVHNAQQEALTMSRITSVSVGSPQWRDMLQDALQTLNGGSPLEQDNATADWAHAQDSVIGKNGVSIKSSSDGKSLKEIQGKTVDTSVYPLPAGNNGYFIISPDPKSPYLITTNPKLNGLGQLDQSVYGDLYQLLQQKPEGVVKESRSQYTDEKQFLGSSYLMGRLKLNPDADYRFLGDAAFDTRYVSNALLNQTGNRYLNGIGSELDQMRYLMDNAVVSQQGLGLKFGVSLNPDQVAALDHSIIWWETASVNGETVMVPKIYLSPKDVSVNNGSVIAGKTLQIEAGTLTNQGSTMVAADSLNLQSHNAIDNRDDALIKAGGDLQLSATADIHNISAAINGKTVALESTHGSIINGSEVAQWQLNAQGNHGEKVSLSHTYQGSSGSVTSLGALTLSAGKDIAITGANLKAGGDLLLKAGRDITVKENTVNESQSQSGFAYAPRYKVQSSASAEISNVGSDLSAGGTLTLNAGNDLNITASTLEGAGNTQLTAGHDLNLNAASSAQRSSKGKGENHVTGQDRTLLTSGGDLTLSAGRDLNSQAAGLTATDDVAMQAGRDVKLLAAATSKGDSYRSSERTEIHEAVRQQGTEITSGGNTSLTAGRDITSKASEISADADLALKAGRDVVLTTATESDYAYREETKTKKGFLKKTTTHTIQEDSTTSEKATQLSGGKVSVIAGNDLTVQGSSIAGDKGVSLGAGNDLSIVTATNTESTYSLKEVKKSGLMGGGLGLSYGKQSAKSERKGDKVTQSDARSLVGAGNGAVTMTAGNNALIKGSDVIAGGQNGDISMIAKNIAIVAGQDQVRETSKQESKSSGFGLSLNITPLDTVRNLRDIMNNTSSVYEQVKQVGNEFGASSMDSPAPGLTYGRSNSKSNHNSESVYQGGSTLNASGNLLLKANGDADIATGNLLVEGSSLNAGGKASLDATRNIDITTAADSQKVASSSSSKSWSATTSASIGALARSGGGSPNNGSAGTSYGSKKSQQNADSSILTQHTSSITAGSVDVTSHKGDIAIAGSTLTGTDGVSLNAEQGKVTVVAGEDSQQVQASGSDHTIGDLGGDGYSGTVGVGHNSWKNASTGTQQNTVRSGIVSTEGDVSIKAAKDVNLQGTDVYAANSLSVNGENIHLAPANDTHSATSSSKSSQYGITAQVSGYGVSMAQAVDKVAQSRKESDDPRLQAIYAAQAAMTALSAYTQNTAAVKVTVSATAGSSHQSMEQNSTEQSGSVMKAGGDVALEAKQDITGQGAKISGDNVSLTAGRDIALTSAEDSTSQKSSSGGSKYGAGVGFGLGGSQNGFSIELAASQNSARGNASSLTHHNSEVTATGDLTVKAGQDVKLNGANLNGNHVDLDAGRNLEIASQQDRADYDSHQSSSGFSASICVPPICAGVPVQGSASMSGSKISNDFDSVQQQSGIRAGEGGYNVFVGNHTQLDGAVIASSASADKNHLSTGTLGWTDIDNHANSGGSGFSVAVSGSMGGTTTPASNTAKSGQQQQSTGGGPLPVATLQQSKDRASSTTYSAISPGTIEIRNPDAQKQDVAQISRDTASAENALKDKFDAQKVEDSLTIQKEMAVLGQQTIQQTFDALKKQDKEQEREKLKNDPTFNRLSEADKEKELDKKAEEKYGIGSNLQIAAQALSGLFAGLAGGNVTGAVSAGAAPLLAQMIKQVADGNEPMRILLHTLASGLIAKAQGGSATGGAAGGLTAGLLSANETLSKLLFDKKAYELSADEKMLVANIVTLAGAAVGGAVDGSTGVGSGASAGRTEVENNYLSVSEKTELELAKQKLNSKDPAEREQAQQKVNELREKDIASDKKVIEACGNGGAGSAACASARLEVIAAKGEYETGNYNNKVSQMYPDAYGQIVNLLNITSVDAQNQQQVKDALTQYAMDVLGVDRQTAQGYVETKQGMDIIVASVTPVLGSAAAKQLGKVVDANLKVVAKGDVDGAKFSDTNQGARPSIQADMNKPTLIDGRIQAKIDKQNKPLPNGNMATAHAEVGVIQQAFEKGMSQGREMTMSVSKEPVCGYCRGDIAAMADKAGLKSLTIYEEATGSVLYWQPGMKSLKVRD